MSERKNLCVFVALHPSDGQLAAQLGEQEALHAAERCANRIERALAAHSARILVAETDTTVAVFERCDSAVLAASDALQRIHGLPPLRGARQPVRIGLHYGVVDLDGVRTAGEGITLATQIGNLCEPEQALASAAVTMLLGGAARALLGTRALGGPAFARLGVQVFSIGLRSPLITSIPAAARVSQRLRLRHQQDVLFVEEHRPVLLLGRELGNDITIMDPRASRQHARIERRREGFVLFDQSTNGTFITLDNEAERCIKQDRIVLNGQGRIGCGFSANEVERDLVFFDIV